jgi:hypothetical protein
MTCAPWWTNQLRQNIDSSQNTPHIYRLICLFHNNSTNWCWKILGHSVELLLTWGVDVVFSHLGNCWEWPCVLLVPLGPLLFSLTNNSNTEFRVWQEAYSNVLEVYWLNKKEKTSKFQGGSSLPLPTCLHKCKKGGSWPGTLWEQALSLAGGEDTR